MLDRPIGTAKAVPAPERARVAIGDRGGPDDETLNPRVVLAMLRRRRWTLLTCAVLFPLAGFTAIRQVTPRYTAVGTLIYEPSEYKVRELQSVLRVDPTTEAVMASQAEVLRSLHVAQRVAERGNLFNNPEFNRTLRRPGLARRAMRAIGDWLGWIPIDDPPSTGPRPDDSRNATLQAVQAALDAHTVKFSRVLEVSFTAEDRQISATAVNNAMDIYIKDQYAAKHRAVDRATEWLTKRADELRTEVRRGEDRIADYRARQGLAQGMHAGMDAEEISHLAEDLVHARTALANAEGRLDAARGRAGAAAQAAIAPSVVQLRAQQDQLSVQMQAQQGRLGSNHPEALSLRRQFVDAQRAVASETARVVAAIEAEQRAARERVATLEQNLHNAQIVADRSAAAQVTLNAMQRDVDASRQQLQAVLESIQKTAQQAAIESPEAHEISLALPPVFPSFPRTVPLMAAAIACGLLAGVLFAYLRELADTSLHAGDEARMALGLPCFALLPEMSLRRLAHLSIDEYVARKPMSPFAEQVRVLRAGLRLGAAQPRIIAVTSARAAEGKTAVALALARSAALSGEHVLVVECDLRRPSFSQHLHAEAPSGLADCLRGKLTAREAILTDRTTGMDVLQAGGVGTDLPDLFLSDTIGRMLNDLRQDYDLILLDLPPVQAMAEARIVAGIADATLLCIRWSVTPRAVAQHVLSLLEETHAHVVGCVLTRVDARAHVNSGYVDADVYHRRRRGRARG